MIELIAARASGLVGSKPSGAALSGVDLIDFDLHADLVEQIGEVGKLKQHADRADQRGLLGHDVIAGDRRDVAAGSCQAVDDDDERLLAPAGAQGIEELLGAGGGAAGTVDVDDDGARRRRSGEPVERSHPLLIVADQSLDRHARDIGALPVRPMR